MPRLDHSQRAILARARIRATGCERNSRSAVRFHFMDKYPPPLLRWAETGREHRYLGTATLMKYTIYVKRPYAMQKPIHFSS